MSEEEHAAMHSDPRKEGKETVFKNELHNLFHVAHVNAMNLIKHTDQFFKGSKGAREEGSYRGIGYSDNKKYILSSELARPDDERKKRAEAASAAESAMVQLESSFENDPAK